MDGTGGRATPSRASRDSSRRCAKTAEQLTPLDRWYRILSQALVKYLHGRQLEPPRQIQADAATSHGLKNIQTSLAATSQLPDLGLIGTTSRCVLQHAKLSAGGLADDTPGRAAAKDFIVAQVERLHWRIWNGKAKNTPHVTIDRIRSARVIDGESLSQTINQSRPVRARCVLEAIRGQG